MEEYTEDAFANRDGPVSTLAVSYDDVELSSSDLDSTRDKIRLKTSAAKSKVREKAQGILNEKTPSNPAERLSLQDRLFTRLLSQVIPAEDLDDAGDDKIDPRSSKYVQRPAFSLPLMTNNFRRFNARVGIIFVFQNKVIRLFSWRTTSHTLAFLAVYTFVCLDPYLLLALPFTIALLFIMVPAFVSRHPPPPIIRSATSRNESASAYSYSGPALAPARTIKPAAETSKDFFRNMRDLQNSMGDLVVLHDTLVNTISPATNFSNEILSSTIFLYLTILTTVLFIAAQLIPLRLILLLGGYAMTVSGHPQVQTWLVKQQKLTEKKIASSSSASASNIYGIPIPRPLYSAMSSLSRITLTSEPEIREVEIFELQHRPVLPAYASLKTILETSSVFEWQPHLFISIPYDPLSPARIAGDRPKGTRLFEDVQPPHGWEWASKKWELDLEAGEWVDERLIVGVGYDAIHRGSDNDDNNDNDNINEYDETNPDSVENDPEPESFRAKRQRQQSVNLDFGGWVWDLPPAIGTSGDRDEDVWLAYGDYDIPSLNNEKNKKKEKRDAKNRHKKDSGSMSGAVVGMDWEESVRYGNKDRTGEWRRRRWVRLVKRVGLGSEQR